MSELYQTVNERRVKCGRCRHEMNQSRVTAGVFDSETGLTYSCGDCHAIYAVCRRCGWYMEDGKTCYSCLENPAEFLPAPEEKTMLPERIKEENLVPDPAGRPGHWHHPPTDEVISMPVGWKPKNAKAPEAPAPTNTAQPGAANTGKNAQAATSGNGGNGKGKQAASAAVTPTSSVQEPVDLTGKPVIILQGRFEGKRGVISESGLNEDKQGITVLAESGEELPFEKFDDYLRFMTPEEIAIADEEMKKEREAKANSGGGQ